MASMLWLVAGLFLGTILVAAAVLLIELATGHGLLGPTPTEKSALAENQQLKEAAQAAERSTQLSLRAKDEQIRNLQADLENAQKKASQAPKVPPPQKNDFWEIILQMANGREQKQAKETKGQLAQAQKDLAEARKENDELKKRNTELEGKLAKGTEAPPPKEDPKKTKPKDTNPKTDTPKNDAPSSLEEENAKAQFEKARGLVDSNKDMAIKLLKKLIDDHPKTQAAKDAKKLLDDLK